VRWPAVPSLFEAIVFDLDGTLYESPGLAAEIGHSAARYVAALRGVTAEEAAELLAATRKRLAALRGGETPLTVACIELGGTAQALHRHFTEDIDPARHLARDEGVIRMMAALQRRYSLYVYTNNNRVLAERILDLLGLTGFFARVFTIEFSWRPKPDQETLQQLFAAIGTPPGATLFVGDRHDIDLRLPADHGSPVHLVTTVGQLLDLGILLTPKEHQ
jgi:putative hydrolase of the HAD superfamily